MNSEFSYVCYILQCRTPLFCNCKVIFHIILSINLWDLLFHIILYVHIFIYSFLIQHTLSTDSTPFFSSSSPNPDSPFLQIYCSSISLQRRASLSVISIGRSITWYNKTRYKPSYQSWIRQHIGEKWSHEQAKVSETPPTHIIMSPSQTPSKQPQHLCREPTMDP